MQTLYILVGDAKVIFYFYKSTKAGPGIRWNGESGHRELRRNSFPRPLSLHAGTVANLRRRDVRLIGFTMRTRQRFHPRQEKNDARACYAVSPAFWTVN